MSGSEEAMNIVMQEICCNAAMKALEESGYMDGHPGSIPEDEIKQVLELTCFNIKADVADRFPGADLNVRKMIFEMVDDLLKMIDFIKSDTSLLDG